jgi:hypothetical protein
MGLAALFILLAAAPAAAQSGQQVTLLQPAAAQFPNLTLNFEVHDAGGSFITDLTQGQVQVLEDGASRPTSSLSLEQPGLQLSLVFDTGPELAYTYNNVSRFQQVHQALATWADATAAPDDYSLITSTGGLGTHLSDARQFSSILDAFNPDLYKNQASLSSLIQAIDLAADPLRHPLMKRAILYVTPMLPDTALQALPNLADRAAQTGIHIFIWLVLPEPASETAITKALGDMAQHTGGQFFTFTGSEPFPDPETYLQPLRYHYSVNYVSAINQSGSHHLSVQVKTGSETLDSNDQALALAVLPPNPMFMAPPAAIARTWTSSATGSSGATQGVLVPETVPLKLLVEFPDGHKRALTAARLYVDSKLVSELTQSPFDTFTWPLAGYNTSGTHTLRVEVVDQLGLTSSSIEIPVEITAPPSPVLAGMRIFGLEPASLLLPAGGVLGGVAVVLAGVWAFRGLQRRSRSRPQRPAFARRPRQRLQMPIPMPARRSALHAANAPARLVHLGEDRHSLPGSGTSPLSGMALDGPELTVGSSPKKAAWVLESTSVDGLHARVRQTETGKFRIFDAGSVAGTWVNYTPVPAEGTSLQHGDLVQLGREMLRFELKSPGAPRKAVVIDENKAENAVPPEGEP